MCSPGVEPGVKGFPPPACVMLGVKGSCAGALWGTEGDVMSATLPNEASPNENQGGADPRFSVGGVGATCVCQDSVGWEATGLVMAPTGV